MKKLLIDLIYRFSSRKFLMALFGVVVILLDQKSVAFNLTIEQTSLIIASIVAYITSEAYIDVSKINNEENK